MNLLCYYATLPERAPISTHTPLIRDYHPLYVQPLFHLTRRKRQSKVLLDHLRSFARSLYLFPNASGLQSRPSSAPRVRRR